MFVPFKSLLCKRLASFVKYVLHAEMDPVLDGLSARIDALDEAAKRTDGCMRRTVALERSVHALEYGVKGAVQGKLRGVYENMDYVIRIQRNETPARRAVYTCITGGYDVLPPPEFVEPSWRWVCFTDNPELLRMERFGVWTICPLRYSGSDDVRNARWHKTHPHLLFPDCEESLWIDSSFTLRSGWIFEEIRKRDSKILIPLHFHRDCVFDEWDVVRESGLDDEETLDRQRAFLEQRRMPRHYGLNETCLVYRRHMDPEVVGMMEDWWMLVRNLSKRDQLSLSLVLFEHGVRPRDIALPNLRTRLRDFQFTRHVPAISPRVDIPEDYRWEELSFPHEIDRLDVGLDRSVIAGWAFLPGHSCSTAVVSRNNIFYSDLPISTMLDSSTKDTRTFRPCAFKASAMRRPDVRAAYDLPSDDVGFHVEADAYLGVFRLCLIDDGEKKVYYTECDGGRR